MSEKSSKYYRRVDVYERHGNDVLIYICFEILDGGGYVVQSADRARITQTWEEVHSLHLQAIELFQEMAPDERLLPAPTLTDAIARFNAQFSS